MTKKTTIIVLTLMIGFVLVFFYFLKNSETSTCFRGCKDGLSYFRTFTVKVNFGNNKFLEKETGYSEDAMSKLILKKLATQVEKSIGRDITSEVYGKNISFDSNPMNVLLTFSFKSSNKDSSKIELSATISRSGYFVVFKDGMKNEVLRKNYLKMREEKPRHLYRVDYIAALEGIHVPYPLVIDGRNEISDQLDGLVSKIVQNMNPDVNAAAEAEEGLIKDND